MNKIALPVALAGAIICTSNLATAKPQESLEKVLAEMRDAKMPPGLRLWEDPTNGCRFYVTTDTVGVIPHSTITAFVPRNRADGKSDCRDVE